LIDELLFSQSIEGKQPFYFQMKDEDLFAFAGLWDSWRNPDNEVIESCTILTTTANEVLSLVHERMPVIIHESDYELWLDDDVRKQDSGFTL
jgi:putative SOS response-associated peptidase YedK